MRTQQLRVSWWPAALACGRWRGGKATLEVVGHSGAEERAGAGKGCGDRFRDGRGLGLPLCGCGLRRGGRCGMSVFNLGRPRAKEGSGARR
jgi:hypothetical protein